MRGEDSNCPERASSLPGGNSTGEIAPGAKGVIASSTVLGGGEAMPAKLEWLWMRLWAERKG